MTGRIRTRRWALLGKRPGDMSDYHILFGGEEPRLAARVWAGVPSTPAFGGAPGPGQLPWATFLPVGTGADRWLAVAVVEATPEVDALGRTIAETRYAEVPFADVARLRAGYQALHAAIPPAAEFVALDPAESLSLDLAATVGPPGPPGSAAAAPIGATAASVARALADPERFDRAAGLAALLIDGPAVIVLTEQDLLPLPDRLAEFDQILALLPFGLRAAVSLASWHDGTQAAAFSLAFGKFAARDRPWVTGGGPVPPPSGHLATSYLQDLLELRDRFGAERVIEHLAGHRASLPTSAASPGRDDPGTGRPAGQPPDSPAAAAGPGNPEPHNREPESPWSAGQEAAAILRSLGDPALVVDAVRRGDPSVDRVACARRYAADWLDQDALDELEVYLLRRDDDEARDAVYAQWSARSAQLAGSLALGQLVDGPAADPRRPSRPADEPAGSAATRRPASAGHRPASSSLLRLRRYAVEHAELDRFVEAIAAGRTHQGHPVPPWTVARLLREAVRPAPRQFAGLRRAVLLAQPDLGRWLLRLSLAGRNSRPDGTRWSDWLAWLDPCAADSPRWLRRYSDLVALSTDPGVPPAVPLPLPSDAALGPGADQPTGAPEPAEAAMPGDGVSAPDVAEDLALITSIVLRAHSLAALADEWWPSLLALANDPDEQSGRARADLADVLQSSSIVDQVGDLRAAVRLDTLRLCLRLPPRHYPVAEAAPACRGYLSELWDLWLAPVTEVDTQALTIRLLMLSPGTDPLGEAPVTLLREVVSDDRIAFTGPVADAIAGLIDATPDLAADPRLPADWWARVQRYRPDIVSPAGRLRAAVRRAQASPRDADPIDVAVVSGRAAAEGMPAADLLALVGDYVAGLAQSQRGAMFAILEGILRLARAGQANADGQPAPSQQELGDYLQILAPHFTRAPEPPEAPPRRRRRTGD